MSSKSKVLTLKRSLKGELQNAYSPLQNFKKDSKSPGDFTTEELEFERYTPIDILVTDEYDGSTNMIINDDATAPKLVNSGFSVQENNTYKIPVHNGNAVTNIYDSSKVLALTSLLKLYDNIPDLTFGGLTSGGEMSCGAYRFYFKLSDADGNMSNVVQVSNIVQCHVGTENTVKVRMGLEKENSGKCIKFTLNNIDRSFNYVRIFYELQSSSASQSIVPLYYMIDLNFPITNGKCEVLLTGKEVAMPITSQDLLTEFADINTAKTQTIVDNTLFLGNISSYDYDYNLLLQIAWRIIPTMADPAEIGGVSTDSYKISGSGGLYNNKNVYYNVGYWPEEFYRFGIVFVFNNNLLSKVLNIQGCDFAEYDSSKSQDWYKKFFKEGSVNKNKTYSKHLSDPEDHFFNSEGCFNSKGVIRTSRFSPMNVSASTVNQTPYGIKFDFQYIAHTKIGATPEYEDLVKDAKYTNKPYDLLKALGVKGFYFVRQKRIPSVIALGIVVGLTDKDKGAVPVLNDGSNYITKSFLTPKRLISKLGTTVTIKPDQERPVTNKALFVPEFDVNEPVFNNIFTSQKFQLNRVATTTQSKNGDHFFTYKTVDSDLTVSDVKLTTVPKDTKYRTDGDNYFSTLIGSAEEPYKCEDVNLAWRWTKPQYLTCSTSLIRGQWGPFVGMSTNVFNYGDIVSIRSNQFKDSDHIKIEFQKRFGDASYYSPISLRYNLSDFKNNSSANQNKTCYCGDCFTNPFTHRVMKNFLDPELPNNRTIVDSSTWIKNYIVKCTGYELPEAIPNMASQPSGFYFPCTCKVTGASVLLAAFAFILGAFNAFRSVTIDPDPPYEHQVCEGFELKNSDSWTNTDASDMATKPGKFFDGDHVHALSPTRTETDPLGKAIKNVFVADDDWELHGIAEINRADINAVSFGQWLTFPVCSSYNLALRDIDFSQIQEENATCMKRAFYPWEAMDPYNHLHESGIINGAAKTTVASVGNFAYRQLPYIKQEFFNRIYWSKPNLSEAFINSYRMIFSNQYKEYNKEYGAITKLLTLGGNLFVVFQHGVGMLQVNRTPQSEQEASLYLPSRNVLPDQVTMISADYGSMWKDSVIQTPQGVIYGIDTVARKIWQYVPGLSYLKFISDYRVNKFLNDWINLSEYDYNEYIGHINVKSHYNEFKHDVIFTYYKDIPLTKHHYVYNEETGEWVVKPLGVKWEYTNPGVDISWHYYYELSGSHIDYDESQEDAYLANIEYEEVDLSGNLILEETLNPKKLIDSWLKGKTWSLCYNEEMQTFTTFYDWYPVESCNINNIYFSFDKDAMDSTYENTPNRDWKYVIPGSNFKLMRKNKVFLDKAFTENVLIYKLTGQFNYLTSSYPISFYYNGTITIDGESVSGLQFGKDNSWKFIYLTPDVIHSIVCPVGTKLAEFKEYDSNHVSDKQLKGVLQYFNERSSEGDCMYLWKHGQAGIYDNQGVIKPAYWYGKQHEFNFEFIALGEGVLLKVFTNLKIISNKTAPNKFEYEIVGEGYDWYKYKPIIQWINKYYLDEDLLKHIKSQATTDQGKFEDLYKYILSTNYSILCSNAEFVMRDFPTDLWEFEGKTIQKIPFLHIELCDQKGRLDKSYHLDTDYWDGLTPPSSKSNNYSYNCQEAILVEDELLNEQRLHTEQLGNDMKRYGRVRGNMQYLEDLWNVEIRPVLIKWAYRDNGTLKFKATESRHRDLYLKVKIRYSGESLAVIKAVIGIFDESYA